MIGAFGKQTNFHQKSFTLSTPYIQDEYTWCIQRAKLLPLDLNMLQLFSILIWIIIACQVLMQSIVLSFLIQFDRKYKQRKHRDLVYSTLLISLPSIIGISQRFHPKNSLLRIYYGFNLLCGMVIVAYIITYGYAIIKKSVWAYQLHTIAEIVQDDFRFAGSETVLESMRKQTIVSGREIIVSSLSMQ